MEVAIVISTEIARRGHCLCEISGLPDGVTRKSADDYPLYICCVLILVRPMGPRSRSVPKLPDGAIVCVRFRNDPTGSRGGRWTTFCYDSRRLSLRVLDKSNGGWYWIRVIFEPREARFTELEEDRLISDSVINSMRIYLNKSRCKVLYIFNPLIGLLAH